MNRYSSRSNKQQTRYGDTLKSPERSTITHSPDYSVKPSPSKTPQRIMVLATQKFAIPISRLVGRNPKAIQIIHNTSPTNENLNIKCNAKPVRSPTAKTSRHILVQICVTIGQPKDHRFSTCNVLAIKPSN